MKKNLPTIVSVIALLALGFEVVHHEAMKSSPVVEQISLSNVAYAQSLDRGFADLAKHAIPSVVNISTYAYPHVQMPGSPDQQMPGQDEMFRRFFEEFFGGRIPSGPGRQYGGPRRGQRDEDQGGEGDNAGPSKKRPKGLKAQPLALGTGFIIDSNEGLILTNYHVIHGAEEVKVQFKEDDQDLIPAEIIGKDPELDVALLKVKTKKLTSIPLGDSDAIDVGEYVLAIGNPLGYGHTVSHGILSAKGRRNPEFRMGLYLQTDASINPGNSGGPLINTKGEVVGINNAIDARGQGIGFAIPINLVKNILGQLKTKGTVSRGYLGVSAVDLTPEIAEQIGINPKIQGVLVADVALGAPADQAGIKPYDVITAVNGEKVKSSQDLTTEVVKIPVGENAKIDLVRTGKPKSVIMKVSERPIPGAVAQKTKKQKGLSGEQVFEDFGFKALEVSSNNAAQFGIPASALQGKHAVVVSDLEYGKSASNAGLSRGDLILDIANQEVRSIADLSRALKALKGKSIILRVKRFDSSGVGYVNVVVLTE